MEQRGWSQRGGVEGWSKVGGAEGWSQRGGARRVEPEGVEQRGWSRGGEARRGGEQERATSPRVIVSQASFLILTLP